VNGIEPDPFFRLKAAIRASVAVLAIAALKLLGYMWYLAYMRLTSAETVSIKKIFSELDSEALVYLYGSRADDSKKGGDIDLLVLSQKITENDRRNIKLQLYDALGEQKIDLLIAQDASLPFVRIALQSGVLL
jgi:uncharacterized protein